MQDRGLSRDTSKILDCASNRYEIDCRNSPIKIII